MSDKRNYDHYSKDFEEAIADGLQKGNWGKLNTTITSLADSVIGDVGDGLEVARKAIDQVSSQKINVAANAFNAQLEKERQRKKDLMTSRQVQNNAVVVKKNEKKNKFSFPIKKVGYYASTIQMVAGGVGLGVVGISLMSALPSLILGRASISGAVVCGVFAVLFAALLKKGSLDSKRLALAVKYAKLADVNSKGYIGIEDASRNTGRSKKQIVKDFNKMLKLGFFPEGHIDKDNTTLMFSEKVYDDYIAAENSLNKQEQIEEKDELSAMIAEGNEYMRKLHQLNAAIPGEAITEKLSRLEGLLEEIFDRVKEHPEQMPKMRELMEYYLPTCLKLVEAYEEYDKVSEPGREIIKAKEDIEKTLETINEAFKKLLNNLFKDSVWDVTADAQVLQQLLAQKGLVE